MAYLSSLIQPLVTLITLIALVEDLYVIYAIRGSYFYISLLIRLMTLVKAYQTDAAEEKENR